MPILLTVLYAVIAVSVIGCSVAYFMVSPWFGLAIPVLFAFWFLGRYLERKYKEVNGIPTLFERAMELKNKQEADSSVAPEK